MVAWSLAWVWIRGEVARGMDAGAERLRAAGYTVDWKARRIGGYPFRIDVTVDGLTLAERSGWALSAPQIRSEAYAYRLDQWIGYAPSGVVLTRPGSGGVAITGPVLRASYGAAGPDAPRVAVEGLKLAFIPEPGANPFPIRSAEHMDFHLRGLGGDRLEFLLRVDGAAASGGVLGAVAQTRPATIAWQAVVTHASALRGGDWPDAVRNWASAGGALDVEHGLLDAGPTHVELRPGALTVGADGRLRGSLGLDLGHAPGLIHALAEAKAIDAGAADLATSVAQARAAGGPAAQADLTFSAGATTFGPVAIGPSPKIY